MYEHYRGPTYFHSAQATSLTLSLNMGIFKKSKVTSELKVCCFVHAAAKEKLMGSVLNVIRAIIDIMPGRRKAISITLQLTLASTQT